ncbi:hypothetical protein EIN_370300 [Entamoeba invadens IP1]|uniref:GBD/FH3 domain-containing protein n=1 Tax=Entamoeba invadens IP1 TaxID=370355 RepID=A0A0A1UC30_ENTIV|nr:hypothetical protein EIN_370300 [Entamoeba invadens IP1]ELP92678.1 hypothetical protein EIN_370300 [Entamoeba invadens IP1]|eukprot:XP_004259449.1 hypothetical protein EIN_370300 [Entamoeba invadens IP1]
MLSVNISVEVPRCPETTFTYKLDPTSPIQKLVDELCEKGNVKDSDQCALFLENGVITDQTIGSIKDGNILKLDYAPEFSARLAYDQLLKATNVEEVKRIFFQMRGKTTIPSYVAEFARLGGMDVILEKVTKCEGNVQAYGLVLLRNVMSFDSGMQKCVSNENMINFLFSLVDVGVVANACRQALDLLFVAIHYGGFQMLWNAVKERASKRNELPLANVVNLMKSDDIETVGNAITLLNGILKVAPQDKKYGIRMKLKYQSVHHILVDLKNKACKNELKEQINQLEKYFYSDEIIKGKKSLANTIDKEMERMRKLKLDNEAQQKELNTLNDLIRDMNSKLPTYRSEFDAVKNDIDAIEKEIEPLKQSLLRKDILKAMNTMSEDELRKEWVKYKVLLDSVQQEKAELNKTVEEKQATAIKQPMLTRSQQTFNTPRDKVRTTKFLETRKTKPKTTEKVELRKAELEPQEKVIRIPWRRLVITPNPKKPTIWDDMKITHVREKQLKTIFVSEVTVTNFSYIVDAQKLVALSVLYSKQPSESRLYEAFTLMYSKAFDQKTFDLLKKALPTEAEAFQLMSAQALNPPETLMKRIALSKNILQKIGVWSQIKSVEKAVDEIREKVSTVEHGVRVLKKSSALKEVFSGVSFYNGQLQLYDSNEGFDMSSLLLFKNMKVQTGETMLDVLVKNCKEIKVFLNELRDVKTAALTDLEGEIKKARCVVSEVERMKDELNQLSEEDMNVVTAEVGRVKSKAMDVIQYGEDVLSNFFTLISWCFFSQQIQNVVDTRLFFGILASFHANLLMSKAINRLNAYDQMKRMRINKVGGSDKDTDLMLDIIEKIRSGEIGRQFLKKTTSNK